MIILEVSDMVQSMNRKVARISGKINRKSRSLKKPLKQTGDAIADGIAISQVDGPIPIADALGLGIAIYDTAGVWYEYFKN